MMASSAGGGATPSSPSQLNRDIRKGKAPNTVDRADSPRISYEKPHVHFKSGDALNSDGTWKHGGRPLSNAEKSWLTSHGWAFPAEQDDDKVRQDQQMVDGDD